MYRNACFVFLLLCIALIQAGPAPKNVEKKSLTEDTNAESKKVDLNMEETGEDKDRSKKSTLCVQIGSGTSQPAQVAWKENQISTQKFPLSLHTQPQQIQTLNVVQPAQTLPQASVVMPQQMVQPVHTLQIVQSPPQPCTQSAPAVNIIQPVPQSTVIKTTQKPKPKPKPVATEIKPATEEEKPMRIEHLPQPLPEPQETLTVLPVASTCHEHLFTVPSNPMMLVAESEQPQLAAIVQVPSMLPCSNPLHRYLNPCPCQQNIAVLSESGIEPISMKVLPIASYSSTLTRPPLVMPYDAKMLSHIVSNGNVDTKLSPHARSHHGYVKVKLPHHVHVQPQLNQQTVFQNMYVRGLESNIEPYTSRDLVDNTHATKEVTINAFPQTFRDANSMQQPSYRFIDGSLRIDEIPSNTNDLMQSNKAPREIDSNQLMSENMEEIKQQDGRISLTDGRRNARSNNEKVKETEKKNKNKLDN
ncbi:uncharacterized protein LOC143266056 [Megachile rotundata]|uniref:uncharacterized protein LOC143266056 n=1 Tax=Megachile rotundata TaxID=143995 RepID=UPI003FD4E6F2